MAVKKYFEGEVAPRLAGGCRAYNEHLIDDKRFHDEAELQAYMQYRFDLAWCELMNYAHKKGIEVIGDIRCMFSDDSADAWSEPRTSGYPTPARRLKFRALRPTTLRPRARCGNPTFRWDHMKETASWWMDRLRRAFALYDRVRLDHFWASTATLAFRRKGLADEPWLAGGQDLFQTAYDELGPLNFIAEDLGYLTPGVRAMASTCGFPGMDVLEFSDYDVRCGVHPTPGKILYTSTHDTSTLAGWCTRSFAGGDEPSGIEHASSWAMPWQAMLHW
ncbi:MAG: 4-alpha-glucanotransferase [Collinsella sp.]